MQQHLRPPACRQLGTGHICAASTVHLSHSFCKSPSRLTAGFTRLLQQHTAGEQHTTAEDRAGPANRRSNSRTPSVEGDQPTLQQGHDQAQEQQQHHHHHHHQQQSLMLLQAAEELASQLKSQQSSLVLYVCAKCQLQCSQQLLHALLQQLPPDQLQQLPPAGLVNAVWALAVLRIDPGDDWMRALYAASSASTAMASNSSSSRREPCADPALINGAGDCCTPTASTGINRHQCVQLIWAAGRLRVRPPPTWLSGLLFSLQPQLQALSPTELTNIIWALAQIGFRPGKDWMQAWFKASKNALPHSSADCLACQVASLGVLRLDPGSGSWRTGFRAAVAQQLSTMRPQHIAAILCGLAKRRSPTPPHWLRLVLTQQLRLLEQTDTSSSSSSCGGGGDGDGGSSRVAGSGRSAADVAATVWSLPLLLYPSAAEWAAEPDNAVLLRQLVTISLPLLPQCSVGELVQLAVGFARLGFYPGAHWLKLHENAVAQHRLSLTDSNRVRLQAAVRRLWKDT